MRGSNWRVELLGVGLRSDAHNVGKRDCLLNGILANQDVFGLVKIQVDVRGISSSRVERQESVS